jgi:hypothetical protein
MADEVTTVPVHCAHCGKPVTLELTDWPHVVQGDIHTEGRIDFVQNWECPHCNRENQGEFPDKMVRAGTGHDTPR